jgi:peroxiredoxin
MKCVIIISVLKIVNLADTQLNTIKYFDPYCPYAIKYEDRINALNAKFAAAGYPVITINSDDSVDNPGDSYTNMQVRAKAKGFTFPYLLDASQDIAKAYGANKTPQVFLVQKTTDGLTVKYTGAIDDNTEDATAVKQKYVELAVDALLAGKDIAITSTKAIGCGIKIKP